MGRKQSVFDSVVNIHHWFKYSIDESCVTEYSANIVMSLEKIKDVYHTLCFARMSLENIFAENFGELIDDDEHGLGRIIIRSTIVSNAISYYNYCIDYSWQVLWLYYKEMNESSFNNMDDYLKFMKECSLDKLNINLKEKGKKGIKKHVNKFFNDKTKYIRDKYNYIKHRGCYHIEGLGQNYKKSAISINGEQLPLLHRLELDLNELHDELIKFDNSFVEYFEKIINEVVPEEIKEGKVIEKDLGDVIKEREAFFKRIKNQEKMVK